MKYALKIQLVDGEQFLTDAEDNVITYETKDEAKQEQKRWANSIVINYADDGTDPD
jgi:hypothetical protein